MAYAMRKFLVLWLCVHHCCGAARLHTSQAKYRACYSS